MFVLSLFGSSTSKVKSFHFTLNMIFNLLFVQGRAADTWRSTIINAEQTTTYPSIKGTCSTSQTRKWKSIEQMNPFEKKLLTSVFNFLQRLKTGVAFYLSHFCFFPLLYHLTFLPVHPVSNQRLSDFVFDTLTGDVSLCHWKRKRFFSTGIKPEVEFSRRGHILKFLALASKPMIEKVIENALSSARGQHDS